MTGIVVCKVKNSIYMHADGRTSAGDYIHQDNNEKIFYRPADDTHTFDRYYVTAGDESPCDYVIHKVDVLTQDLGDLPSQSLYDWLYETETLKRIPTDMIMLVIHHYRESGAITMFEIGRFDGNSNSEIGSVHCIQRYEHDLPLYYGSGSIALKASHNALQAVLDPSVYSDDHLEVMTKVFDISADIISSMGKLHRSYKVSMYKQRKRK